MDLTTLRRKAYKALGYGCECCGTVVEAFLEIGHRNDDGAISRRLGERESGHNLYRKILKMTNPKSLYELTCSNCNQARRREGKCPHAKE